MPASRPYRKAARDVLGRRGDTHGDAGRVRDGARVIVAAAIIMISVFGSFILESDPTIKQFGVGLSVAVFLAGLMVILLAPAMLALFGERTFWVPAWLGRILPHVDLESPPPTAPAPVPEERLVAVSAPREPDEVSTRSGPPAAEIPPVESARGDGQVIDVAEVPEPRSPEGSPRHKAT
jgi:MMPL family